DLTGSMLGVNASSYVRVPFTVADPGQVDKLTLRMKYDDGFVGYLNGESIVARNAPKGGDSPDTGLVAYFPFDNDLEDRASDFPSNSGAADNDLAAVGGTSTTFVAGQVGQAISVNTSTADRDRFTTPLQSDLDLGGQFTVEAWIYPTELTGFGRLVMEWDGSGRNSIFFALRNGSQLSVFHVDAANVQRNVDSPIGTIELGSTAGWQHVAVVGDGAFLRLYHNGVEVSAGTGGTATVPTPVAYPGTTKALNAGLGIGDSAGAPAALQTYEGYVDEVALWRVPLTAAEIASHFDAGSAGYGLGTIGNSDTVPFNAQALGERPEDEDGVDWEQIDISDHLDALQTGANVLAIHGLNVSASDADFLMVPELIAGRVVLDPANFGYFEESTPDAANGDTLFSLVADINFSHERGYYSAPLALEITTTTPDVTIRYTTDGSAPTETTGTLYTEPIAVGQTRTVRAAAFKAGFRPSEILSHTYVFVDQVLTQTNQAPPGAHWDTEVDPNVVNNASQMHSVREGLTSLPTLSIAMSPGDLFGASGIYQNPQNRGDAWVRPGSVEFFYPDEYTGYRVDEGFQINSGVRIQGIFSRLTSNPKHSFRLSFQERFGPSKLEFPLYEGSPVTKFDNLIVLNGHNQSWATGVGNTLYLRDPVSRDLQELAPGDVHTNTQYVNLYLNGMYWGLFGLIERPDETFAAEHFGGDKDNYDVLKGVRQGETTQAMLTNGGRDVWDAMFILADQDMAISANYAAMQQYVDIDQLIDYNIGILYTADRDGPTGIVAGQSTPKNFYALRHRSPEGRFRFYPWDADFTFEDVNADVSEREGTQNPARLHFHLRANPEYRLKFADHVRKWFFNNGPLTPGPVAEQFLQRAQEIDQAVVAESARWGDAKREPPYTRDVEWVAERNRIVNSYIPARSGIVLNQFLADGLYPTVAAPDYTVDGTPQHGGAVETTDSIGVTTPTGTAYYTTDGSDPRTGPPSVVTTTLVADTAPVRAIVPTDGSLGATWQQTGFSDASWLSGTSGVGYDRGTAFSGLIGTDLLSPAIPAASRIDTNGDGVNENNSVYSRYAFNVADPNDIDSLTLNMRYDDGFVAYLNGHEVARANAPASPQFNSAATLDRGDSGEVMIAIVYDSNNQITIYRNGQVYATAANTSLGTLQTYPAGVAEVLFGLRHIDIVGQTGSAGGTDAYLAGSINEARLYSAALSAAQLQQVFAAGPLLGNAAPPADANLRHLWSFNANTNDQVGTSHGTANGGASVTAGRLVLDGVNDYVRTAPINSAISTKTLVTWVSMANLTQAAGSAMTLENPTGADTFDGIVFAERAPRQWMAGSNGFTRTVANNGGAAETVIGGQAIGFEPFDVTAHRNRLTAGTNVLAIHALNSSVTDGNMIVTPWLEATNVISSGVSPTATAYGTPFSIGETTLVKSRTHSPTGVWSALTESVFTVPLDGLAVSEIMYHPVFPPPESVFLPDEFEFFEIQNVSSEPINLAKVSFTGGIEFDFATSSITTLEPGAFVLIVANASAFEERYGTGMPVAGQYTGNLANEGETVTIADVFGTTIKQFTYGDGWYSHTDGEGFSLTRTDPTLAAADLSQNSAWRPSNLSGGSPGSADSAVAPGAIVVHELLANSTGDADGDWIELHNTTNQPIDIGHWYLSNDAFQRQKYQLQAGTIVPAGGFRVVTQNGDFGSGSGDPGALIPFELSRHGDALYLTGGDALGRELGYRDQQTFEATELGVSLGIYIKSTDGSDFVRLVAPTKGAANSAPMIGPLVVNEVMYHPAGATPEFIELHNVTSAAVPLDDGQDNAWRIRGAVDYVFPLGRSIPAGGYALLVQGADGGNPVAEAAAFRTARGVPSSADIFIYTDQQHGSLSNGGEKIFLDRPGSPNSGLPETPYILIDAVKYDDESPWTTLADGGGPSLSRFSPTAYGNDVINWGAGANGGTPGTLNVTLDTSPPTVPQNLSGRIVSSTQVRLRWDTAADAQSG
ncbi:MAG: lamin tail domain-containing protein, partial [Pirellulales bacterium]